MTPFADFLRVSFPLLALVDIRADLDADLFAHFGPAVLDDHLPLGGGSVMFGKRASVGYVSFSGQSLAAIRAQNLYGTLLGILMCRPHRVTRLDIALDLPGTPAEPLCRDLFARGRSGAVRLTRKAIQAAACSFYESIAPDNTPACTAYLGRPRQTRVRIYDKAREQWMRAGITPSGELTRVEVQCRAEIGMTLHDAYEPAPLFWHLVAPDVLPRPAGVSSWSPNALGYALEKTPPPLPAQRAKRVVALSDDLALLGRIAVDMGSADGLALVKGWACQRIEWAYLSELQARAGRAA